MDATTVLRLPDGTTATLAHGDLVGRLETAALHLSDPRISEAHAMVSQRGASLKLVALRGRMLVEGFPLRDVELVRGLVVHLAPDFALTVDDVVLPDVMLGLAVGIAAPQVLTGVCSLVGDALERGYRPDARAWFWPEGADVIVRRPGHDDHLLALGETVAVDGVDVRTHTLAQAPRSFATTVPGTASEAGAGMTLVARYTSVHLRRDGARTLVIGGLAARIMSELVIAGVPMPWLSLAREIWPDLVEPDLRARWDVTLSRLRKKLTSSGLRADLVRSDRHGNVELCLAAGDVARDET